MSYKLLFPAMIVLLNDVMFFILHLIGLCLCTVNMLSFWSCVFHHGICELSGAHHALLYPLKKSRPVYASPIHSDLYLFLFSSPSSPSPSRSLFSQASPAPIIVNTDTLESVPYVSFDFSFIYCMFMTLCVSRDIADHPLDQINARAEFVVNEFDIFFCSS